MIPLLLVAVVAGGLQAWNRTPTLGSELQTNGGFESGSTGWSFDPNYFHLETTPANCHGGTGQCITAIDLNTKAYSSTVSQSISVPAGSYKITGWLRTEALGDSGHCVRIAIISGAGGGNSTCAYGTTSWTQFTVASIIITTAATVSLTIQPYAKPSGQFWADDLTLQREVPPDVVAFLLYPRYRGMLFSGEATDIQVSIINNLGSGTVVATVVDQADQSTAYTSSAFSGSGTMTIPRASLTETHTYLLKLHHSAGYDHPNFKLYVASAADASGMRFRFDENNRFIMNGNPRFLLGVYDSGLGYVSSQASFDAYLSTYRRLWELPIDLYLNYWYGVAPAVNIGALESALAAHGATYLQTGNCFASGYDTSFLILTSDAYVTTIAGNSGFAGFYTMDECIVPTADDIFAAQLRLADLATSSISLGASNATAGLDFWRDAVDVLSMDPYPLYGAEPAGGYNYGQVATWTAATKTAIQSARPFMTVIQFFKFTSKGRWPTEAELKNMSYMAIVEGSNGLFYWSLGAGALGYVCTPTSDWCTARVDYFTRLKNTMNELNSQHAMLDGTDQSYVTVDNSNCHHRDKLGTDAKKYVIATHVANSTETCTFTITSNSATFQRTVGPWGYSVIDITASAGSDPAVVVSSTPLPDSTRYIAYSRTLTATGGNGGPYTWNVSAGALPTGVTLSGGGVVAGTPTQAAATYNFTAQACDSLSSCGTQALNLVVAANLPVVTTLSLPIAVKDASYSFTLEKAGGTGAYTWDITAGTLCTGLSLSGGGVISGTPTVIQICNFTVRVTDGNADTDTQALSIQVPTTVAMDIQALPGSTYAVVIFGAYKLPVSASCTVSIKLNSVAVLTTTSSSGSARRVLTFSPLTANTPYTAVVDCAEFGGDTVDFVTLTPSSSSSVSVDLLLRPKASLSAARVTVDWGIAAVSENTTTNTSCSTGCTVTLAGLDPTLPYLVRHIWKSAGGATLATSRTRVLKVDAPPSQ